MEPTEEQRKELNNFINTLKNDYRYNIENFDKQAIYIAGGSLAISLTFIKDIVPLDKIIYLGLYYFAISFFAFSILLGFLSFLISSEIINHNKKILEKTKKGKCKTDNTTSFLNYINAGLISIGILLIVLFTILNLNNYNNINSKKGKVMTEKEKLIFNKKNSGEKIIKSLRADDLPQNLRDLINAEPNTNDSNYSNNSNDSSTTQSDSLDNDE